MRIRITGQSYDRFLNLCANRGIFLKDLVCDGDSYLATLSIDDFRSLKPLARKSRTRVRIVRREGLPFFLYRYRHRKMLFPGMAFGIFLMFFLSFFVWDIQIEGNLARTDDVIFDFLEDSGVTCGIRKSTVDCKELAASIRRQFDNFTWVSVKLQGTRLLIQVQENNGAEAAVEEAALPCDLVSDVDGVVESIITRNGIPLVKPGDEVQKGDILVSGRIPIIGDDGEEAGHQECAADADIRVRCAYSYHDSFPMAYEARVYTGRERKSFALTVFGTRLSIPKLSSPYDTFDILTREYKLKLSGNFCLPVVWETKTVREYGIQVKNYTEEEAKALANERFLKKMENFREKGVQISENNVRIDADAKTCVTAGTLVLVQDAGERRGISDQ